VPDRLRKQLFTFAFVDEFGPLYAVYPLWFASQGLSIAEISWVYVLWASVGIVLEVPSGALADRMDRRRLVAFAIFLRALGISLWFLWPTFGGIVAGALLWAIHSALASGAWEALVHDELTERGEEEDYPVVMARLGQANHLGVAGATLTSAGLLALGFEMPFLGALTVVLHLPAMLLVLALPNCRESEHLSTSFESVKATFQEGLREAWTNRSAARLIALGAVLEGLFILDEYVHLLAQARGLAESWIPLVVGLVWVGLLAGGELAARRPQMSERTMGTLLFVCSAMGLLGLLSESWLGAASLALVYGALNVAWILSDARMQARLPSEVRATVTSVRSVFSSLFEMSALALVGVLASEVDPTPGLILLVAVLCALSPIIFRLRALRPSPGRSGGSPA
jgi:MFS family permease